MMASNVLSQTANFTLSMPQPKDSTGLLVQARTLFVGDNDIQFQNHRITYVKDIAPSLVVKGDQIQVDLPKSDTELPAQPGTLATATVHSTPIQIGQLPIADDGTITGAVTLPADIETGYHQLHISYVDIEGKTIDRYGHFYAASSADDWDGDGTKNDTDPCSMVLESGSDKDHDGIDDACDGEYVLAASSDDTPSAVGGESGDTTQDTPSRTSAPQAAVFALTANAAVSAIDIFGDAKAQVFTFSQPAPSTAAQDSPIYDSRIEQDGSVQASTPFVYVVLVLTAVMVVLATALRLMRRG